MIMAINVSACSVSSKIIPYFNQNIFTITTKLLHMKRISITTFSSNADGKLACEAKQLHLLKSPSMKRVKPHFIKAELGHSEVFLLQNIALQKSMYHKND